MNKFTTQPVLRKFLNAPSIGIRKTFLILSLLLATMAATFAQQTKSLGPV
ncbi:MAG: hypothetical protein JWM14_2078 [Chitinophagaceae bacterium]|nr:hypothetical protein [Chitinophagaceae bacterium]